MLLNVRKTFTSEFSSVLVLGSPMQASAGRFLLLLGLLRNGCFKTFIQVISFSYGHSSWVIPVVLSLEAGRDFLYFAILVMVFQGVSWG